MASLTQVTRVKSNSQPVIEQGNCLCAIDREAQPQARGSLFRAPNWTWVSNWIAPERSQIGRSIGGSFAGESFLKAPSTGQLSHSGGLLAAR